MIRRKRFSQPQSLPTPRYRYSEWGGSRHVELDDLRHEPREIHNPATDRIMRRPANDFINFIVILVDDMGWMDLSCQWSDYYRTPNIDRLAAEGMRFTDGYAASAVCSPSRAAVQTGRYPGRIGVTDWIRSRFI